MGRKEQQRLAEAGNGRWAAGGLKAGRWRHWLEAGRQAVQSLIAWPATSARQTVHSFLLLSCSATAKEADAVSPGGGGLEAAAVTGPGDLEVSHPLFDWPVLPACHRADRPRRRSVLAHWQPAA